MDEYNVEEALELLKEHNILFAKIQGIKSYFIYKGKLIFVISGNARYKLNKDNFMLIHKDTTFYVDDSHNDCEINPEKDKEYYSWRQ